MIDCASRDEDLDRGGGTEGYTFLSLVVSSCLISLTVRRNVENARESNTPSKQKASGGLSNGGWNAAGPGRRRELDATETDGAEEESSVWE